MFKGRHTQKKFFVVVGPVRGKGEPRKTTKQKNTFFIKGKI